MMGVINGFAVIFFVVAIGYCTARWKILNESAIEVLARIVYFIATPALLFEMLGNTPAEEIFSTEIVVAGMAVIVVGTVGFVLARYRLRQDLAGSVISMLAGSYSNSTNLGVPIATYILGGQQYVAPLVLFQMVIYQPVAIMLIGWNQRAHDRPRGFIGSLVVSLRGFMNPMLLGGLLGILVSVAHIPLPSFLHSSLSMVGAMTVPSALLIFGMSFVSHIEEARETVNRAELFLVVFLKAFAYPLTAYVCARYLFHLAPSAVLAATVLASLPTANMVYVLAVRYRRSTALARDASLLTTVFSVPVIFAIVWLLG